MEDKTATLLEHSETKVYNDPDVSQEKDYKHVEFGNTGFSIDTYSDTWAMSFQPDIINPIRREDIYNNGLRFVYGMYKSIEWFENEGRLIDPTGLVRNDTNERMHRFRLSLFGNLSSCTGITNIYKEIGREGKNYLYELRYDLLTKAVRSLEKDFSAKERNNDIRFFDLLSKANKLWKDN